MSDLIEKLRRSIEDPSIRKKYFGDNNDKWSKFCVSMDTLEDSDLAISFFLRAGLGNSDGERYLRLYGTLQAVFIQQEALAALWEIIEEKDLPEMPNESSWIAIRRLRNHSAGHPIEVTRDRVQQGITRRTFVNRIHLERGILSLITDEDTGKSVHWGGNLREVLRDYLKESGAILKKIHGKIREKWPELESLF